MDYTAAIIACLMLVTAIWMLLHGIRGYQKGVIIETRKSSSIKDYYYRGDFGFYVNIFFYIVVGTAMVGFSAWLFFRSIMYW